MLRKVIVGWSIYAMLFIAVRLSVILFSGIVKNEYVSMTVIVITTMLLIIAGNSFLDEFVFYRKKINK